MQKVTQLILLAVPLAPDASNKLGGHNIAQPTMRRYTSVNSDPAAIEMVNLEAGRDRSPSQSSDQQSPTRGRARSIFDAAIEHEEETYDDSSTPIKRVLAIVIGALVDVDLMSIALRCSDTQNASVTVLIANHTLESRFDESLERSLKIFEEEAGSRSNITVVNATSTRKDVQGLLRESTALGPFDAILLGVDKSSMEGEIVHQTTRTRRSQRSNSISETLVASISHALPDTQEQREQMGAPTYAANSSLDHPELGALGNAIYLSRNDPATLGSNAQTLLVLHDSVLRTSSRTRASLSSTTGLESVTEGAESTNERVELTERGGGELAVV